MYLLPNSAERAARFGVALVALASAANVLIVSAAHAGDSDTLATSAAGQDYAVVSRSHLGVPAGGGELAAPSYRLPTFVGEGAIERMKAAIGSFWLLPAEGFANFARAGRDARDADPEHGISPTSIEALAPVTDRDSRQNDLALTLNDARRDAGEFRALSDEVRLRADELSERFSIGAWAMGSEAAALATIAPASAALVAAVPDANDATRPIVRASADNNPFRDLIDSLIAPPIKTPDFASQMGLGNNPSGDQPATPAVKFAADAGAAVAGTEAKSRVAKQPSAAVPPQALVAVSLAPRITPLPSRPRRPKTTAALTAKPAAAANPVAGKSAGP